MASEPQLLSLNAQLTTFVAGVQPPDLLGRVIAPPSPAQLISDVTFNWWKFDPAEYLRTQASPFLTLSNAVARLSSNIYETTSYSFAMGNSQALTNQTFTFGTDFTHRVTLTWATNNPPGVNQIAIFSGGSGSARSQSNAVNLFNSITSNIVLPSAGTKTLVAPTLTLVSSTGTFYSVATDMTNVMTVSSNQNTTVTNFVPYAIRVAAGFYNEPNLSFPGFGTCFGAGSGLSVISNSLGGVAITLNGTNVFAGFTVISPGAEPVSFGSWCDSYVIDIKTIAQTDGFVGGGGIGFNHIWNCAVTSQWDSIYCSGSLDIRDTRTDAVGPWLSSNIISTGLRGGNVIAWNSTFNASGSATNRAFDCQGGSTTFNNCTFGTSTNGALISSTIYNEGFTVTESGCTYDHALTFGTILHDIGPQTISIDGTTDSSGVVTGYFPVGKVIVGANFFPTNNPTRIATINSLSGTNSVAFAIYTNGIACGSCVVVGPATGYEQ